MKAFALVRTAYLVLLAILLTACSPMPGEIDDSREKSGNRSVSEEKLPKEYGYDVKKELKEYKDVLTLTGYYNQTVSVRPDNYSHNWILENFKIDLKSTYVSGEIYDEKLRTLGAANQMPDIMQTWSRDIFDSLSASNLLLPLDDLLYNYVPSAGKWYSHAIRDMMRARDGKLYTITGGNLPIGDMELMKKHFPGCPVAYAMNINEDLLKKTGLEIPRTIDELYGYLKAVAALPPVNGKEIIPLEIDGFEPAFYTNTGYPGGIHTSTSGTTSSAVPRTQFIHLMEQQPDPYNVSVDEDNRLVRFVFDSPTYVKYLKFMSRLYRERLLDRDAFMQSQEQLHEKMKENRVGLGMYYVNIEAVNSALSGKTDRPYMPIEFPRDPSVKRSHILPANPVGAWYYAISSKVKDPVRVANYLEWHLTDEGMMFDNYGPPDPTGDRNTWAYDVNRKPDNGLDLPYKPVLDLELQRKWDTEKAMWEYTEVGTWGANSLGLRLQTNYAMPGEFGVCMASDYYRTMILATLNESNIFYITDLKMTKLNAAPFGPTLKQKGARVNDILNKWEVRIIMTSANDAEIDTMYRQMMQEAKKAGYEEIQREAYEIYSRP